MNTILKKSFYLYIILILMYLFFKLKYFGLGQEYSILEFITLTSGALIPLFIFSKKKVSSTFVVISYGVSFYINMWYRVLMDNLVWITSYILIVVIGLLIDYLIKGR